MLVHQVLVLQALLLVHQVLALARALALALVLLLAQGGLRLLPCASRS